MSIANLLCDPFPKSSTRKQEEEEEDQEVVKPCAFSQVSHGHHALSGKWVQVPFRSLKEGRDDFFLSFSLFQLKGARGLSVAPVPRRLMNILATPSQVVPDLVVPGTDDKT